MIQRWCIFGPGQNPHEWTLRGVAVAVGKTIPLPGGSVIAFVEFPSDEALVAAQAVPGSMVLPSVNAPLTELPQAARTLFASLGVDAASGNLTNVIRRVRDKYAGAKPGEIAFDISDPH